MTTTLKTTSERAVERTSSVPPQDLDAEAALLGAMLLSDAAAAAGVEMLSRGDFYGPAHGHIFGAIAVLVERGEPIDAVTVVNELRRMGVAELVDPSLFISLQANTPSIAGARQYANIVRERSWLRRRIGDAQGIVDAGYRGDTDRVRALVADLGTAGLEDDGRTPSMRRWSMAELLDEPSTFAWLVRGLLADPTYGQVAGPMKALKSLVMQFLMVGVSSGTKVLGRFDPLGARPVLAYVGEGGRALWTRRIRRICAALNLDPRDLDLHPVFDVAPIASPAFAESLRSGLSVHDRPLVGVDPWYSFHGTATRASDLHDEGALLNMLSTPCMDAGASLLVVNHFNQSGNGTSLRRITMAGSGEWADSWVLLDHREPPDVAAGSFKLSMEVGSRQWGGTSWDLDLELGRFDEETGTHDGEITWDLRRSSPAGVGTGRSHGSARDSVREAILDALSDMPWRLSKTEVKDIVRGDRRVFATVFDDLVESGVIRNDKVGRKESGTTRTRLLWGLAPTGAESLRPGSAEEGA